MFFINRIPTEEWVPFLQERFRSRHIDISAEYAEKTCNAVENYSSYVQQLAWNVLANTQTQVDEQSFEAGLEATMTQMIPLFVEQTAGLTTFQMNFLRAICHGYHRDFGSEEVTSLYPMGTRNNLSRVITAVISRELVELQNDGTYDIPDPLFKVWFRESMM